MTVRFTLHNDDYLTVICAYAPTLNANNSVKENFYTALDQVIVHTPNRDHLLILIDFNARVGSNHEIWTPIGHNGIEKIN